MKISYLNIGRGFAKKADELEIILNNDKISILGLGKTDLLPDEAILIIPGFRSIAEPNKKRRVCAYVNENIDVEVIEYEGDLPAVVFHTAQMTVGYIYCEFTRNKVTLSVEERREALADFLGWFDRIAKNRACLQGDFNINFLENTINRSMLYDWMAGSGFEQTVREPTRVTAHSSTMIDLSFIRGGGYKTHVQDSPISDHDKHFENQKISGSNYST